MVRDLERVRQTIEFPKTAPAANPVFFRTYSRRNSGRRETWEQVCDRTLRGLIELGKLTPSEAAIVEKMQHELKSLPSGRWLWVGGTQWIDLPENFSGAYNCTSTNVVDWQAFGLMMDLAMMGCGTGAVLEPQYINCLPSIRNHLNVTLVGEIGTVRATSRQEQTTVNIAGDTVKIRVGDSRSGWVKSYQTLLELSSDRRFNGQVTVEIDPSNVRPAGETLKGFGGVANPVKLPELYTRCAAILNKAVGRQLNSVECCLLIDEAAVVVVAGNVRRCIAYGTRVAAAQGMLPIQDIQVGDLVLTSSGEYRPVLNKFIQGVQDVVEIRTTAASIRCTANHRVAVYDGLRSYKWKQAGELQKGDRLISVPHTKGLPCSTTDYAWLVGFFLGDGHADIQSAKKRNGGGGTVSFAISTPRLHGGLGQKILRILTSLGYNPALHIQETHAHILVYRKELALELGQYKQAWGTPVIPEFIWCGSREIRAAFLAGLSDADGTPSRNVLLNSNKLEFLRDVQRLALSLGIATRVHERSSKTLVGRETVYEGCHWLHVRGLQSQALAVALINQFAVRDGFTLKAGKKNGLSLPYQFVQEAAVAGWRPSVNKFPSDLIHPSKNDQKYRDANWDTLLQEDAVNPHWLPMEVQLIAPAGSAETFDIEVEGDHEFIANGLLVHNSAGMRQGTSNDELFAQAKNNLWQQDDNGSWRIDPERDALRMANHTLVFHHKPTREECIEAVRKQYYSGEGAIQWAGEAIARANVDILNTSELKKEFIKNYATSKETAHLWLQNRHPKISKEEVEHRLSRYGLNPCVTADTWIHTGEGARQVKDLIGVQHSTYVNGELFSTTPQGFFYTGIKQVVKLQTKEGYSLRLTENHQVLKVTAQTQHKQYSEWVAVSELKPGDRVLIHNHRELSPWDGKGTEVEGWLLGSSLGDGCFSVNLTNHTYQAKLRYWGNSQVEMKEYALSLVNTLPNPQFPQKRKVGVKRQSLAKLAATFEIRHKHKVVTPEIEQTSYKFYCGFLRGLFDADGSVQGEAAAGSRSLLRENGGTQNKGVSIRLSQSNLQLLEAVQRMLLRLGIASCIYKNRRLEGTKMMPGSNRELAEYFCKAQHELVIANDNIVVFQEVIGFQEPSKALRLESLLSGYKKSFNRERFAVTVLTIEPDGEEAVYDCTVPGPARFDANGFTAHNCGEIIGANFHCNLSEIHLNQIDPKNYKEQESAFTAGALSVAALLNHKFGEERYQKSRELDPIVGVSFTGLFDFFVHAFGVEWLRWWEEGRPETAAGLQFKQQEIAYLIRWKEIVHQTVWDYCDRHHIKPPNRCTTVQPSGTKSLLTGASPGWHPPKAQRFIRRITFRKNDPVALACIDYGYNVVPSQSDKDEFGNLLNDPFDLRCTEWLVEIPVAVSWADLPGADQIEISQFSAASQMDFYMQVQKYYVTHNTSATIELREQEIEALGDSIYQAILDDRGYISAALLARFDAHQSFPRLPFEPISKQQYDQLSQQVERQRKISDFQTALNRYDLGEITEAGPAGCDSDKCIMPEQSPAQSN